MKISQKGIDLIKTYEGLRLTPYLCAANVPTIGYGSTRYEDGTKVRLTDQVITQERAVKLFDITITPFQVAVMGMVTSQINQNQFDALVSFAYNLGAEALRRSTLLKKVNANPSDPSIDHEFTKWCYAGSRRLLGLVRRREAESKLYFSHG